MFYKLVGLATHKAYWSLSKKSWGCLEGRWMLDSDIGSVNVLGILAAPSPGRQDGTLGNS